MRCSPAPTPNELDRLGTVNITIKNQPFVLWVADELDEREHGLMQVTHEQMTPLRDGTERGMLFVFPYEDFLSFWMKDTIIPLDIAYVSAAGVVVGTYTMAPLDVRYNQYPSKAPARYAIEVNAGVWARLGLQASDRIEIPDSVLNRPR
ncbi:MAG TPA: DUF192 domain-containing protein [Phycisphaerae bacterium]|nr:DUF192 domain-containing protein [Phycisphaerae bacterium]HNU45930.1 DUF192 domain-containing protein [Phycisphaerae bacterium]